MSDWVSRAGQSAPTRLCTLTHTRKDPAALQGGSPARLAGCLCLGFSCATWESIGSSVANCCSVGVGSTPTGFLSFHIFLHPTPFRASYAPFEGVVLSQNFNSFVSGPKRSPPTCSEPIGSCFFSEGHTILGLTLARGVRRSWEGTVTPAGQRGLGIKTAL